MTKCNKRTALSLFIEIIRDPDRKSLILIIYELFYLLFIYKELPVHYFNRYLFKKNVTNIRNYLPDNFLRKKISLYFHVKNVKEVLDNKLFFDLFYSQFNLILPKILLYNHKKMFILNGNSFEVNNVHDFLVLLEKILEQYPSSESILIKKTYSSSSGKNIYKLFRHQIRKDFETVTEIYSKVIDSEFLFQETIKQHPDVNKLNPSSLNTIRFDTFIDQNGNIDIISAYIRMSINNSCVDNINAGGCGVGISLQTGKLKKFGYAGIKTHGTEVLTAHPITKTIFENCSIPFFKEAKELVLKAASYMPVLRLVGWDIGISESGPVLIEGNSYYEISGNDQMYGGYLNNTIFRKVLQEIKYL